MEINTVKRIGSNELKYVTEVLSTEFRSSSGATFMRRFEEKFTNIFDVKYGISFVNGTATMHAALEALGIGVGDEVIVPPLTMSATTFAVLQANATPIFADVNSDTFQIDPNSIEKLITPNTKAIITVALYGLCPDMDPIISLAKKHGIFIIEDNAECFLGKYKNQLVGTLGDCASFSFQSSKHLTSGEGGIIITKDSEFATNIRRVQSLGYAGVSASKAKITKKDIQDPNYLRHVSMGWNYRMPELCCAVALAQVENIERLVAQRVKVAQIFHDATCDFHTWFTPQVVGPEYIHSYWTWVCKLNNNDISWHEIRDSFCNSGGDGIYAAWQLTYLEPMFKDLNLLNREKFIDKKILKNYRQGICPIAESIQSKLFQFKTNYWNIKDAEVQAEILRNTLKKFH